MVDLVTLQATAYVAQIVGVVGTLTAAFIAVRSYVNANKRAEDAKKKEQETRDRELQTREAQLFSSIYRIYTTIEMEKAYWTVGTMKLETISDWNEMKNDVEKRAEWGLVVDYLDGVGVFVGEGLLNIRLVAKLMGGSTVSLWENIEKGIKEARREYNFPRIAYDTEYLYNRLKEYERDHPEMFLVSPSRETFKPVSS